MGSWFEMGSGGEETLANFEFGVASRVHTDTAARGRELWRTGGLEVQSKTSADFEWST